MLDSIWVKVRMAQLSVPVTSSAYVTLSPTMPAVAGSAFHTTAKSAAQPTATLPMNSSRTPSQRLDALLQ